MIAKMIIFVKVIAYSLASNFIAGKTLAQQYGTFDCKKTNGECPTMLCESNSKKKSTLPLDSIPDDTCSLTISAFENIPLVITSADTFHKFKKLQNLETRLGGSLEIAEKLPNSTVEEHLSKVLFDIPELKDVSIEYTTFNRKNSSWMLPASVEKLHLSNGVLEFDLRNCSRLTSLRLNNNELRELPLFHDPLPPLEILDMKYNPLDKFRVNDIAGFCYLKYLALDADRIKDCECTRLKQWIVKLKEWGDFNFEGSLNCSDIDSSNCTLEEAELRREKCLSDTLDSWKAKIMLGITLYGLVITIVVLLCCVGCCYCIVVCTLRLFDDPERKARRQHGVFLKPPKPLPPDTVYPRQQAPSEEDDADHAKRPPPVPQFRQYGYGSPY